VQRKFPTILTAKFLKTHFGGRELVNAESKYPAARCTNKLTLTQMKNGNILSA